MANIAKKLVSIGGGKFVVTATYDDTNDTLQSFSCNLTAGTAEIDFDLGGRTIGIQSGSRIVAVAVLGRTFNRGDKIGFRWSAP